MKLLVLALTPFGIANMWEAVFADVGVMVIAILNASRALQPGEIIYNIVGTLDRGTQPQCLGSQVAARWPRKKGDIRAPPFWE